MLFDRSDVDEVFLFIVYLKIEVFNVLYGAVVSDVFNRRGVLSRLASRESTPRRLNTSDTTAPYRTLNTSILR